MNKIIVQLIELEDGGLGFIIPEEVVKEFDLREGDTVRWDCTPDGGFVMDFRKAAIFSSDDIPAQKLESLRMLTREKRNSMNDEIADIVGSSEIVERGSRGDVNKYYDVLGRVPDTPSIENDQVND